MQFIVLYLLNPMGRYWIRVAEKNITTLRKLGKTKRADLKGVCRKLPSMFPHHNFPEQGLAAPASCTTKSTPNYNQAPFFILSWKTQQQRVGLWGKQKIPISEMKQPIKNYKNAWKKEQYELIFSSWHCNLSANSRRMLDFHS